MTAFVANTNNLELIGLKSAATGEFVNDADVSVTVKDGAGDPVSGETWPMAMIYVTGSNGDYRGIVSHAVALSPGRYYTAEISVDAGGACVAFWAYPFLASLRQD